MCADRSAALPDLIHDLAPAVAHIDVLTVYCISQRSYDSGFQVLTGRLMRQEHFKRRFSAALREPLLHFLLLGAAIYMVYGLAAPTVERDAGNRIAVTAGEINWLTSSWEKRWNRAPTAQERAGLIGEYVRETIFYREALAMGLDRDDTIIRRRLAQKLEFLTQDLIATVPPTDEELRAYFAAHAERYQLPALTTFTQVFVDPDRRGDGTFADAEAIGVELRALDPPTEGAAALGDPFMLQAYYPERSELEIAQLFGGEFARTVSGLVPGQWHGPVASGYGLHLVYVESRSDIVPADFAAVRGRVQQDWQDERRRVFNEEYYASLRARYNIVIEDEEEDSDGNYAALLEDVR
jgi:peptidyl-prolyl cis-trans isomerase C